MSRIKTIIEKATGIFHKHPAAATETIKETEPIKETKTIEDPEPEVKTDEMDAFEYSFSNRKTVTYRDVCLKDMEKYLSELINDACTEYEQQTGETINKGNRTRALKAFVYYFGVYSLATRMSGCNAQINTRGQLIALLSTINPRHVHRACGVGAKSAKVMKLTLAKVQQIRRGS